MKAANIHRSSARFELLQTTDRSQTTVIKLGRGQTTGEELEFHETSDQVMLVIEGEVSAQIDRKRSVLKTGDVIVIPPGARHKFTNIGPGTAVIFSVYSPPDHTPLHHDG